MAYGEKLAERMRGMVFVAGRALRGAALERWIERGVEGLRESTAPKAKLRAARPRRQPQAAR
jgi:hypothetical protein